MFLYFLAIRPLWNYSNILSTVTFYDNSLSNYYKHYCLIYVANGSGSPYIVIVGDSLSKNFSSWVYDSCLTAIPTYSKILAPVRVSSVNHFLFTPLLVYIHRNNLLEEWLNCTASFSNSSHFSSNNFSSSWSARLLKRVYIEKQKNSLTDVLGTTFSGCTGSTYWL